MNFSTTNDDFTTLKNGIDKRITFIKHIETGFYNITKAHADIIVSPPKLTKDWFKDEMAQRIIEAVKTQTDLDYVHFELKAGTPKQFIGIYVHELLVNHFLSWLDINYTIRISQLLDNIHQEANKKVIKEKNDKIDELKQIITRMEQSYKDFGANASRERREILGGIKEFRDDIDDLNHTVINNHHSAIDIAQHLY
jgi:hypothetical protein